MCIVSFCIRGLVQGMLVYNADEFTVVKFFEAELTLFEVRHGLRKEKIRRAYLDDSKAIPVAFRWLTWEYISMAFGKKDFSCSYEDLR